MAPLFRGWVLALQVPPFDRFVRYGRPSWRRQPNLDGLDQEATRFDERSRLPTSMPERAAESIREFGRSLKLLLDEHFSPHIARQLRSRGHDVVAVTERAELLSVSDRELLALMRAEGRVMVTNNAVDYVSLFGEAIASGVGTFGILLTHDRSLPRTKGGIGLLVGSLEKKLLELTADDALRNQILWLP